MRMARLQTCSDRFPCPVDGQGYKSALTGHWVLSNSKPYMGLGLRRLGCRVSGLRVRGEG